MIPRRTAIQRTRIKRSTKPIPKVNVEATTGDVIADGDTKEKALLALACSAVCTIDALNQPLPEKSQP
jgi:hypothetical protein